MALFFQFLPLYRDGSLRDFLGPTCVAAEAMKFSLILLSATTSFFLFVVLFLFVVEIQS